MPRKNVDSYSPGKIKNWFPRNRCVKFLDSPPPRYRSEAPVCSGIFVVVTCPLLPFFCSDAKDSLLGASVAVWAFRVLSSVVPVPGLQNAHIPRDWEPATN
ncbi:hypothetical protein DPMN_027053 [Dreissena polymorpha]|uniref:Uncharacterized protein n=1 Tax=Dreissena polymorpha TaxID=45954 RepID=A0A9D4LWB2_DREPO|nr:hypothetical protein DPMN_027053 [Dreissena polymorpha]